MMMMITMNAAHLGIFLRNFPCFLPIYYPDMQKPKRKTDTKHHFRGYAAGVAVSTSMSDVKYVYIYMILTCFRIAMKNPHFN